MRSMKSKIFALLAIILVVAIVVGYALLSTKTIDIPQSDILGEDILIEVNDETIETEIVTSDKETIYLWYTDESLTDYLNLVAVGYGDARDDVRVIPTLVSGREYLENISKASVEGENYPDLYITTNDTLEKAHLAGLADVIKVSENKELTKYFPEVALDACTYEDEIMAYPFFYECAVLLYNETYFNEWAKAAAEAEIDMAEGEAAQEQAQEQPPANEDETRVAVEKEIDPEYQEKIEKRAAQLSQESFPTSIDKLLAFSDTYDAPEQLDGIFKWDVTDIFYNYFFIGDSINAGGKFGDDPTQIDLYNEAAIRGLSAYQNLNTFFSISTGDIDYEGVLDDFKNGKVLFSIVTSDAIRTLSDAKANGEMEYDFAFANLPDIMDNTQAKSMSVTDVVAINGYSIHKDIANDFAAYLCEADGSVLYERAGKMSAMSDVDYGEYNDYMEVFMSEYVNSSPLPKMLETSNLWVELEMMFASVWDGADANKELRLLSEQMKMQITGEKVSETPIVIEEEVVEEDEIIETDTLDE